MKQQLGAGRPLPSRMRNAGQHAFGSDLGEVRVHDDAAASAFAVALGASAFTTGTDIAFAPGRYRPDTLWGAALLAHELAHVEQQRRGGGSGRGEAENDANRAALALLTGGRWAPLGTGLRLQRCDWFDPPD